MKTPHTPQASASALDALSCTKQPSCVLCAQLTMVLALMLCATPAWALPQNWAGPGGTTSSPTSGIWDTNTPNWDTGVIFTNNNGAVFGGADASFFIQVATNFNVTNITFNASG